MAEQIAPISLTPWGLPQLDALRDPELRAVVQRNVEQLQVEFLMTNSLKPHVVFNLKLAPPPDNRPDDNIKAVRMSMEWYGDDNVETGYFEIKGLNYLSSARLARGAFDFTVLKKNLRVWNWYQIIRGRYQGLPAEHQSDLTQFRFIPVEVLGDDGKPTGDRLLDGCRDFMQVASLPRPRILCLIAD